MGKKKKHEEHGGGHGWFVTFADLMSLLMSFFVVVVAFSTQDKDKMKMIAGSMRDAFGMQERPAQAAIIEVDGLPVRGRTKNVAQAQPDDMTIRPGPIDDQIERGPLKMGRDFVFATAAATLRQALQDMPEIAELSRHIMVEQRPDGVALQLMDQDGRSMFAEGSKLPYERTRRILSAVAPALRSLPQRIRISGHASSTVRAAQPEYGLWELTADRANAVRAILAQNGVPADRFYSVEGKADTEPMFPDDPYIAANRRVTILLMTEAPPVPFGKP